MMHYNYDMKKHSSSSGFTLIEVILVLAIAALIIVIVLLTLPGVMRSQRDNERKAAIVSLIGKYSTFIRDKGANSTDEGIDILCFGSASINPACALDGIALAGGMSYVIRGDVMAGGVDIDVSTLPETGFDTVNLFRGARCGDDGIVVPSNYWRNIAGIIRLESGGNATRSVWFCQNG